MQYIHAPSSSKRLHSLPSAALQGLREKDNLPQRFHALASPRHPEDLRSSREVDLRLTLF